MSANKRIRCIGYLVFSMAIPFLIGILSSIVVGFQLKEDYEMLLKPIFSPPSWVFPIAFSIIYILLGIATYKIAVGSYSEEEKKATYIIYGISLLLQFLWPCAFFKFQWYGIAFIIAVLLWFCSWVLYVVYGRLDRRAGTLLVPYILWIGYALYLNLGIVVLQHLE